MCIILFIIFSIFSTVHIFFKYIAPLSKKEKLPMHRTLDHLDANIWKQDTEWTAAVKVTYCAPD